MFSGLVQRLFFREAGEAKKSLQSAWLTKSKSLGEVREGFLNRGSGRISFIHISPSVRASGRCIIFCHPISKKAKFFFTESKRAQSYLNGGDQVFAFDFNGFGQSDSIDLYYWRDVASAIQYVKEVLRPETIVLHGASFGAFHMLRAMELLPKHSKVVVENVNKSLMSYWKRWKVTSVAVKFLQLMRVRAISQMDLREVTKTFTREDIELCFIACEKDELTTVEEMQELYSWFKTKNKSFTLFPGAGHLSAPTKNLLLYQQVIL